ncbi:DUF2384 domain-containing protein [Altererythrobacter sp. SALINAS58]|uniref:antitoxin Xre/MbcA/ParS toxin-binding domain-containing protein n=1 Tax=Alteripontixanthobacter muriae TaxID=2705546 RepID=UPI001576816D|nr:antitoxin Xre/MbcA/ParS toxin-binding domain-containing protein [Alteripontixanthobacter muriae]NTZ41963.1 DUF2384 domain-containing protein [Alteripontixanthobacter muriae]
MAEEKISAPASYWRRRPKSFPIPAAEAERQGAITRLAFLLLGKDAAIAFLNTEHSGLGGRPLDLATGSPAGESEVSAILQHLAAAAGEIIGSKAVAP